MKHSGNWSHCQFAQYPAPTKFMTWSRNKSLFGGKANLKSSIDMLQHMKPSPSPICIFLFLKCTDWFGNSHRHSDDIYCRQRNGDRGFGLHTWIERFSCILGKHLLPIKAPDLIIENFDVGRQLSQIRAMNIADSTLFPRFLCFNSRHQEIHEGIVYSMLLAQD